MYTAKIKEKEFSIALDKETVTINSTAVNADILQLKNDDFHVLLENKSYRATVLSIDTAAKEVVVRINGNKYTVGVKDQFDALLHQLGMDNLNAAKVNEIKAPMPGLVLKVLVTEGQAIKKGDSLLILEAMKMENSIKAPVDAVIKAIKIKATDKVEKNQVLIQLA